MTPNYRGRFWISSVSDQSKGLIPILEIDCAYARTHKRLPEPPDQRCTAEEMHMATRGDRAGWDVRLCPCHRAASRPRALPPDRQLRHRGRWVRGRLTRVAATPRGRALSPGPLSVRYDMSGFPDTSLLLVVPYPIPPRPSHPPARSPGEIAAAFELQPPLSPAPGGGVHGRWTS